MVEPLHLHTAWRYLQNSAETVSLEALIGQTHRGEQNRQNPGDLSWLVNVICLTCDLQIEDESCQIIVTGSSHHVTPSVIHQNLPHSHRAQIPVNQSTNHLINQSVKLKFHPSLTYLLSVM